MALSSAELFVSQTVLDRWGYAKMPDNDLLA